LPEKGPPPGNLPDPVDISGIDQVAPDRRVKRRFFKTVAVLTGRLNHVSDCKRRAVFPVDNSLDLFF